MAENKGYNGWTNYETWCVNLWLDNDEGMQEDMVRICSDKSRSVYDRCTELREYVEETPEASEVLEKATFVCDLFRSAMDTVNWREIVENHEEDAE